MIYMEEKGMDRNSAAMYIDCFTRMTEGEVYKRGTSAFAAELYINRIRNDYGKEMAQKAIESLEKHVQYAKEKGYKNAGLEEVLQRQKEIH